MAVDGNTKKKNPKVLEISPLDVASGF